MVKDVDKGAKAMLARLKKANKKITVGIHAAEGSASYEDGATVADVASWNHFGTANIPARPFITGWVDAHQADIKKQLAAANEKIVGGMDPGFAFKQFAQWAAGQVQKGISAGVPPPDADSTVRRKGSATPLINSGQLRASIRGMVT